MKTFIKLCLWALAFVPLVVDDSVFFPYISGKMLLIRAVITIVAALILVNFFLSDSFKREIYSKLRKLYKNPVFITTVFFMAVVLLSTVFAFNKYRAFFGDVERAEGLLGLLFYFSFFPIAFLIFEREDWLWFFKLSLFSGLILFIKALTEISPDVPRPGAYTGNPTFLAGYFLFVILSALVVFYNARKDSFSSKWIWKIFAGLAGVIAVAGIFVSQTRGTMLGLAVGFLAVAIYWVAKGKEVFIYKKTDLRKAALVLIGLMVIFSATFFSTRTSDFWQKIPGIKRFASVDLTNIKNDPTIQTRLISLGVSLKAINPSLNGYERFLIGWGPENFTFAYNKYYNPKYYEFEHTWFDRAHNKLMDMLVMHGVLGFLAYIALWISFIWLIFRKKGFSFEAMALLLFGVSYFIHLLFVFDQVSTYIPFFASLAFLTFVFAENSGAANGNKNQQYNHNNKRENIIENTDAKEIAGNIVLGALSLFFLWALIFWTIVPYFQMKEYLSLITTGDAQTISNGVDGVFSPYNYDQQDIRGHFIQMMLGYYGKDQLTTDLFEKALSKIEELVSIEPYGPRQLMLAGKGYEIKGRFLNNQDFLKKAESYYRRAYDLAPTRQDIIYSLAVDMAYQGRFDEAIELLRVSTKLNNNVPDSHYTLGIVLSYSGEKNYKEALDELEYFFNMKSDFSLDIIKYNKEPLLRVYAQLSRYFYKNRDQANFITVLERIKDLSPENSEYIDKAIGFAKKGQWSLIEP